MDALSDEEMGALLEQAKDNEASQEDKAGRPRRVDPVNLAMANGVCVHDSLHMLCEPALPVLVIRVLAGCFNAVCFVL